MLYLHSIKFGYPDLNIHHISVNHEGAGPASNEDVHVEEMELEYYILIYSSFSILLRTYHLISFHEFTTSTVRSLEATCIFLHTSNAFLLFFLIKHYIL